MKVLVTGGAGYIGSFMARRLLADGHEVIIADSLVRANRNTVPEGAILEEGDLLDNTFLDSLFTRHQFEVVFHFAGYISVGESMKKPDIYYLNNVNATVQLLNTMVKHGCLNIIFSSSAAVYGTPVSNPIPESHPKQPESPYGHSKYLIEEVLAWYQKIYGLRYVALRYFNASGADLEGKYGEGHNPETHMIPSAILALLADKPFTIYGHDYDTPDGTCIRDYIHVLDLVEAHVLAWKKIQDAQGGYQYNVGTGDGYSNKEVTEMVKKVANRDFTVLYGDRRPGDPSLLVADATAIQKELGFKAKYSDLETIVTSAWRWHTKNVKE